MATEYIREYSLTYNGGSSIGVGVSYTYKTQSRFSKFPTEDEANKAFGTQGIPLYLGPPFEGCTNLIAAPKLPDHASVSGTMSHGLFTNCGSLVVAPALPKPISTSKAYISAFEGCTSIKQGPVIQHNITNVAYMFRYAAALESPVSLPGTINQSYRMFKDATNVSGEMIIRPASLSNYTGMFEGTMKPITLYGDKTLCETLAATADNANVRWSAWYDPTPAVTDRGQGSYTTAADMTRMVRNGALAVSSYAPGRMVYSQGDIVREDEWNALVEAAQTIDPTVTYSTVYSNLNKIEAAFDSAL